MSRKFVLYKEIDGKEYDVELPLTSNVDPKEIRDELGLPSYVDLKYFPMENAVVTLWAAINAPEMHQRYPEIFEEKICKNPIPALLFGGGAVKILCRDANTGGKLTRDIKDTDYIVPKKMGWRFFKLLVNMDQAFGTHFTSFETVNDRRFNGWRHGERYRATTISGVTGDGTPKITVMDILCDSMEFRHKVEVKDSFDIYRETLYTIGLENLILSKSQFITDIPKEDLVELKKHRQDYRVLSYPYYNEDKAILGMEEKDVKDICAIFLDYPVSDGTEGIDSQKMRKKLKDKKLALTFTLNLRNLVENPDVLERWIGGNEVSTVTDRIETLLKNLPKIDKKWDKPWWNTAVETPVIE